MPGSSTDTCVHAMRVCVALTAVQGIRGKTLARLDHRLLTSMGLESSVEREALLQSILRCVTWHGIIRKTDTRQVAVAAGSGPH